MAAEQQARLIGSLLSVSGELLATLDTDTLLQNILKHLKEIVSYHAAAIHMLEGEYLRTYAGVGPAQHTVGQSNFHTAKDYVWQFVEKNRSQYVSGDVQQEPWVPLEGFQDIRSYMAVPLIAQRKLFGILTIDHMEVDAYDRTDVEVVRIFANQAAIAIENSRLLTDSHRYIRDLETLHSIGNLAVSQASESQLTSETLKILQENFDYDLVSIYKKSGNVLELLAQVNHPPEMMPQTIPLSRGVMSRCARTGQAQLVADVRQEEEFIATAPDICSELCVPIFIDDEIFGVLNIESTSPGTLGDSDLRLLQILANRLGVSVQNIRLYEDVNRRLTTLASLHAGSLDLISEMDESRLLSTFIERVTDLLDASAAGIFLDDPSQEAVVAAALTNFPLMKVGEAVSETRGIINQVITEARPLAVSDYAAYAEKHGIKASHTDQIGALGLVPLFSKGRAIGAMAVSKAAGHKFDTEEMHLIGLLANQIATAIDNRRMFQAEQRRTHQLTLLHEITRSALEIGDLHEMLSALANQLGQLIGADSCYITFWDDSTQRPIPMAASGSQQEVYMKVQAQSGEETVTAHVLAHGAPLVLKDAYNSPYLSNRIAQLFPAVSILGLPLLANDKKIGAALLAFHQPHTFTEEEIAIGSQAAVQASVAISKARLLQTERRQRQFTEVQLSFSYRLMNTATQEAAVQALLDTISEVVAYDTGSVILLHTQSTDAGVISAVSGYTNPEEALHRTLRISEYPLLEELRTEKKPVYFPEIRGETRWRPGRQEDPQEVRSILLAPLLYNQHSEVLGCLTLKSYKANAFSLEDRNNILLLCNQTAGSLHNLRLFEETRRRLNEVSMLANLSEKLNRTLDFDELLQFVLAQAMQILEEQGGSYPLSGAIILRQQPADILQLAVSYNMTQHQQDTFNQSQFTVHDPTFFQPLVQGEWLQTADSAALQETLPPQMAAMKIPQLVHIPMEVNAEVIGLISANRVVEDPGTRQLLTALARFAGAAIHKSQLFAQARKQAVELMEAYDALHQMDRERDEFIQNITHDLRAPLTFVRGYAELLSEGTLGDVTEEQREALEIIQERTDAVSQLVNDILQVKTIESQPLKEEPVFIETVAHSAVRSALAAAKESKLDIILDIESDRNCVQGDAQRLGQVFDNLLSNAIKYSGDRPGDICVRIQRRSTKVVTSISDQGIGIPEAELDKIWDRYYRVSGPADGVAGTGLGLANVRRIVEAHGGQIWVESGEYGTTFTFELPLWRKRP